MRRTGTFSDLSESIHVPQNPVTIIEPAPFEELPFQFQEKLPIEPNASNPKKIQWAETRNVILIPCRQEYREARIFLDIWGSDIGPSDESEEEHDLLTTPEKKHFLTEKKENRKNSSGKEVEITP